MSLKDNFNQAVKEILKKEGMVGDDLSRNARRRSEADKLMASAVPENSSSVSGGDITPSESGNVSSYTDTPRRPTADEFRQAVHNQNNADPFADFGSQSEPDAVSEPASNSAPAPASSYERFEYKTAAEEIGTYTPPVDAYTPRQEYSGNYYSAQRTADPSAGSLRGGRPPETPYYETEETTIISRNTRISGDISSFANVNVDGSVQGDIKLTKNISVSGKVVGNIECNNAVMTGAQMQGSISSKGQVQIDHDSILLGNIDTQYLDLNGRIKGNVDVGGKAEFKNDAVIVGDITASTISVIDGAVIKGFVNTTFMQDSASNVFPEAISVGE